jgi:kynurenine formamidase
MCDGNVSEPNVTWHGWPAVPSRELASRGGGWIDLTYPFSPDVPRISTFEPPRFERIRELDRDRLNVTRFATVVHVGTHLDAPNHFVAGAPAIDAIPLERLMGHGVVVRIDKGPGELIDVDDLEGAEPAIEPGDIVAIDTGWAERWGTPAWGEQPSLTVDAARWFVRRYVKIVAVDTSTPDLPVGRRPEGFTWPVHQELLSHGVLVAEQMANLRSVAGRRFEFLFAPIPLVGADGAPCRVLARPIA